MHHDIPVLVAEGPASGRRNEDAAHLDGSRDLDIITDWSYSTGSFPLTQIGLQRMIDGLAGPRPKYYFAMALILFVRTNRTPMEEEAFQKLKERWEGEWFDYPLGYEALQTGAPLVGRCAYSVDQKAWCETRLNFLSQLIKDPKDRTRIGIPNQNRSRGRAQVAISAIGDNVLLGEPDKEARAAPSSLDEQGGARAPDSLADVCAAAERLEGRVEPPQSAESSPANDLPQEKIRKVVTPRSRKQRRKTGAQVHEGAPGTDEQSPGKRGMTNNDGRVVSVKDGRPLKAGNNLKQNYSNNYRDDLNDRKFCGRLLTLGEAFKLAVVCHYGPKLPADKSGHQETRVALFRTAAYYSMSMDGEDERVCRDSPEFPEFLFFLVQSTKQLRYACLTRGRVYFGEHVFSTRRPSKRHQSKCFVISV